MTGVRSERLARLSLALVAAVLFATAVPGVFSIDEDSYIASIVGLRNGTLKLDQTAGLKPSGELLSFDAAPLSRQVSSTPVTTNIPPLYAAIALPFSWLGLRGLIALQILSFTLTAWLVFRLARRTTGREDLAWLALATFTAASFSIEYAQGIWPHMLAVALVMTAIECTSCIRAGARRPLVLAALAGVCVGLAAGIRYQDVIFLATTGVSLLWAKDRLRVIAVFAAGCAIPLVASAAMNASRLGSWNPVSKGPSYLSLGNTRSGRDRAKETVTSSWARIVDYSTWPVPAPDRTHAAVIMPKNSQTGAYVIGGAVKKALLQSTPWVIVPLIVMLAAWMRRRSTVPARRELQAMSLAVVGVVGALGIFGFRHDGWCFNQRYLLELMPLFSIALALSLVDRPLRWVALGIGAGVSIAAGAVITHLEAGSAARQIALLRVPLLLAVSLAATWLLARSERLRGTLLPAVLGACLGWATIVHLCDDVQASRAMRRDNLAMLEQIRRLLPTDRPVALFAFWGKKDPFGPLLLERDIVIVDPWIDDGKDAATLLSQLEAAGRTVYVWLPMPRKILDALFADRLVEQASPELVEVQ